MPAWPPSIVEVTLFVRLLALALVLTCGTAASVPVDVHLSVTDRSITFVHDGTVVSTAIVCPGYAFDEFGTAGPRFSPDNHWVLIDVKGPFTPGNVQRTQALVQVTTGAIVLAPNFPTYLGVPTTLLPIAWASGQRATLAYPNGKSATIVDPPLHPIPSQRCIPGALPGSSVTPVPQPTASPYSF